MAALGSPDRTRQAREGELWLYTVRGLVLGIVAPGQVAFVGLITSTAGDVDGIRVGDTVQSARQRWGKPVEESANVLVFDRGAWYAVVSYEGDQIVEAGAQRKAR
jgi:hypothetical protein